RGRTTSSSQFGVEEAEESDSFGASFTTAMDITGQDQSGEEDENDSYEPSEYSFSAVDYVGADRAPGSPEDDVKIIGGRYRRRSKRRSTGEHGIGDGMGLEDGEEDEDEGSGSDSSSTATSDFHRQRYAPGVPKRSSTSGSSSSSSSRRSGRYPQGHVMCHNGDNTDLLPIASKSDFRQIRKSHGFLYDIFGNAAVASKNGGMSHQPFGVDINAEYMKHVWVPREMLSKLGPSWGGGDLEKYAPPPGKRRSKRTRMGPVFSNLGEEIIYRGGVICGVIKAVPVEHVRRKRRRKPTRNTDMFQDPPEGVIKQPMGPFTRTITHRHSGQREKVVLGVSGRDINFTDIPQLRHARCPFKSHIYIATLLDDSKIHKGFLRFDPRARSRPMRVEDYQQIWDIRQGELTITIDGRSIRNTGANSFFILKHGMQVQISNPSDKVSVASFEFTKRAPIRGSSRHSMDQSSVSAERFTTSGSPTGTYR
ncbi:hypothetical protein ADUPG1_006371, partial [Aduncisulcus paluster]